MMNQFPSHSGIYSNVKEEYGLQALQAVRYYVRSASKESRLRQHIAFSQRCRCYILTPRSLAVRPQVLTREGHHIAARAVFNSSRRAFNIAMTGYVD